MDLPLTLHLLDLHSLRLKLDPLTPAAALPKDAYPGHAIQDYPLIPSLTTWRLLKRHLPCPLESIQPIGIAQVVLTNAFYRELTHLPEKLNRRKRAPGVSRCNPAFRRFHPVPHDFRKGRVLRFSLPARHLSGSASVARVRSAAAG